MNEHCSQISNLNNTICTILISSSINNKRKKLLETIKNLKFSLIISFNLLPSSELYNQQTINQIQSNYSVLQ